MLLARLICLPACLLVPQVRGANNRVWSRPEDMTSEVAEENIIMARFMQLDNDGNKKLGGAKGKADKGPLSIMKVGVHVISPSYLGKLGQWARCAPWSPSILEPFSQPMTTSSCALESLPFLSSTTMHMHPGLIVMHPGLIVMTPPACLPCLPAILTRPALPASALLPPPPVGGRRGPEGL